MTTTPDLRVEMAAQVRSTIPDVALEALCSQVQLMRLAAERIRDEDAVVTDAKGNATEHPAIRIEREAAKQVRDWLSKYPLPQVIG